MNPQSLKAGDFVYLQKEPLKGKLSDQYTGSYEILEILPLNNVKINVKGKPRVVHQDKVKLSRSAHFVDPG